ncbi:uncharacterized protein LOC128520798 [Clarias gariepinus]|uniref:uncharacterized protein LOC128520798 n=1 Tax=Clarias gariepinus TaxID=13013 RepID=UPI00234D9F15|nr:uncharacterized protein LOC128520798 [Clarias gariepinus]XP_053351172.1 uncharacterized protein LOC128520798 [Clarias gariepinus]
MDGSSAECLSFVSWNTCGIKNTCKEPQKFSKLLSRLSTFKADVVFLQETRVGPECSGIVTNVRDWKVYFTVHSSSSKGVAIMIRKSVPFEYICHDEDCSGGYIVLFCHLHGQLYTLVNVYKHKDDRVILPRLKEYLRETAEGILVVGGDFNIVLHPGLDRKTSTSRHSTCRGVLEDFIVSLNLKDIWSYLHPTKEGFTRHQKVKGKDVYSRLDMFFMPENKLKQVYSSKVKKHDISDHYPVVLKLKVQQKTKVKKKPNVATRLEDCKDIYRRPGKISGAEILSEIKSLTDLEERCPDTLDLNYYRTYCCPLSETLKEKYNNMLREKRLLEQFNKSFLVEDRHIFNIDYLILSHVLANRIETFITSSFKQKTGENFPIVFHLYLETGEQEIKWSFLLEALKKLKRIPSAPPPDLLKTILDCILPKVRGCSERRRLLLGCPLTDAIVNLALKHLKENVFESRLKCSEIRHLIDKHHVPKCKEVMFIGTVDRQRRVLCIHTQLEGETVHRKVNHFKEQVKNSGLKYTVEGEKRTFGKEL